MNEDSVNKLRSILGLDAFFGQTNSVFVAQTCPEEYYSLHGNSDMSDSDNNLAHNIRDSLFNENENEGDDDPFTRDLPKLKAPDKGDPISGSVASLINDV